MGIFAPGHPSPCNGVQRAPCPSSAAVLQPDADKVGHPLRLMPSSAIHGIILCYTRGRAFWSLLDEHVFEAQSWPLKLNICVNL
eukprot:16203695-Heterocapsa_arctica.AAC.1